jgi:hypothetical protein
MFEINISQYLGAFINVFPVVCPLIWICHWLDGKVAWAPVRQKLIGGYVALPSQVHSFQLQEKPFWVFLIVTQASSITPDLLLPTDPFNAYP